MSLFRRQRRPLARLAFFAFLCGWMLPSYEAHPQGLADDAACLVAPGDNRASSVGAPGSEETGEQHCLVCHLQRGLSGASPSAVVALSTPFECSPCAWLDQRNLRSAACAAPSSRGPPALLSF